VRIDGLTTGTLASVDARFAEANRLTIETRNVKGFTLKLAGHPMYLAGKPLSISIDGQAMKLGRTLSYSKGGQGWQPSMYVIPSAHKRAGAEGPIRQAVSARHIYIYGTGGTEAIDELEARRQAALHAANWSSPHEPLLIGFRVVADKEASARDLRDGNLVLFGNKETNAMIARLALRLPIALNASAADYGLVFVFPLDGQYVVVNSGLPWWTGLEEAGFPGPSYVPLNLRALMSFGDYVLFKGSLENVVAAGRFTDDWRIPAADAEKMRASGAVEIK